MTARAEPDPREGAVLEAWLDARTRPGVPSDLEELAALRACGWLEPGAEEEARMLLRRRSLERPLDWVGHEVTQGAVLAAFAEHCREELDDVDVLESTPTTLVARWRSETSRIELRAGFLGIEHLAGDEPLLVLGDLARGGGGLVAAFLDDAALRSRVGVLDLAALEKIVAVRSSVFVHLEWFLRDAYGVKVLPAAPFTAGLVERGIISLGMG